MNKETIIKYFGEEWVDFMIPFVSSEIFSNIMATLKKEKAEGTVIYPEPGKVFRCFKELPLSKVRVIIIGQDPYPKEGYATGLAFGHAKNLKTAASLEKIIDSVEKDAYGGLNFNKPSFDTTLESWAKQGVLLLNTALTVKDSTPGSHAELWKPFIEHFVKTMNLIAKDIIWLSWGSPAQNFTKDVNPFTNFLFSHSHPAKAAIQKEDWDCKHFSLTNACIVKNGLGEKIVW